MEEVIKHWNRKVRLSAKCLLQMFGSSLGMLRGAEGSYL